MNSLNKEFRLQPVSFCDLPGWEDNDPSDLFSAMRDCLTYIDQVKPYRTASLGLSADDLRLILDRAVDRAPEDAKEARLFFEQNCIPFKIELGTAGSGFVTAFYEPEVMVSDERDGIWAYPFYRRPGDLIELDQATRPPSMESGYMFGRSVDGSIQPYPDRGDIDRGFLEGRGLEIAYARSKLDVFFAHVQGAARLKYADGRIRRITYDGKAGHPFSAIGKLLVERGEIEHDQVSMQTIRAWLEGAFAQDPAKANEVLWHNRSYIFFREAEVSDPSRGPVAAAKVPLVPGRSLAVDRAFHTFGFPFYVTSKTLTHLDGGKSFSRLMLALDTGSAIIGPARGDIFTGSGHAAGEAAGTVRNAADFYILLPREIAHRFVE